MLSQLYFIDLYDQLSQKYDTVLGTFDDHMKWINCAGIVVVNCEPYKYEGL
jgi:hypothetical protein